MQEEMCGRVKKGDNVRMYDMHMHVQYVFLCELFLSSILLI
jgi:hypothetical protein